MGVFDKTTQIENGAQTQFTNTLEFILENDWYDLDDEMFVSPAHWVAETESGLGRAIWSICTTFVAHFFGCLDDEEEEVYNASLRTATI